MADIIEFPSGKKREIGVSVEIDADPQTLLEHAIVSLWMKLGGFKLKIEKYNYHMCFMAFADMCFSNMEIERFSVDENGFAMIDNRLLKELKEYMDDVRSKATPPTNDK